MESTKALEAAAEHKAFVAKAASCTRRVALARNGQALDLAFVSLSEDCVEAIDKAQKEIDELKATQKLHETRLVELQKERDAARKDAAILRGKLQPVYN